MPRVICPTVTLILISMSFVAGRIADGFRALPAMLPGNEAGFSHELDDRICERLPIGTSEGKLIDYLASEQFVPEWRRRDSANASSFVENGLICKKTVARRLFACSGEPMVPAS
jgi:hypothetical protein